MWLLLSGVGCVPEGPPTPDAEPSAVEPILTLPTRTFRDDFERSELGPDYLARAEVWQLAEGQLCVEQAQNQGVWLQRRLPDNVRIELDAVALSTDGDLKVELFGDGRSGASGVSYDDATSYIAILGGWKNTRHVLARLDEHASDRQELAVGGAPDDPRSHAVEPGQVYQLKFERRGNKLSWWVNDTLYFELVDDAPLLGEGHAYFGFNNWAAPVCFDNLVVTPL